MLCYDRNVGNGIQDKFRDLPTPNIADNMSGFFCVDSAIKPMNEIRGLKMLGHCNCCKSQTADNLLVHKAIEMAQP